MCAKHKSPFVVTSHRTCAEAQWHVSLFVSFFAIVTISRPLLVAARVCRHRNRRPSWPVTRHMLKIWIYEQNRAHSLRCRVQKRFGFCDACNISGAVNGLLEFPMSTYATTAVTVASATLRNVRYSDDRRRKIEREK